MALEIERKYLVNTEKWDDFEKPTGQLYRQGYISKTPEKTIRVRLTDYAGYMTIKGETIGLTRKEFEYEIPKEDASALLDTFAETELSKVRHKVMYAGKIWEVDVFLGENEGLIVAEIELQSEDESFEKPEWISLEVTGIEKYYNSRLSEWPYKKW